MKIGDVDDRPGLRRHAHHQVHALGDLGPRPATKASASAASPSPSCRPSCPRLPGGAEPLPEGIFYLLLLGEIPTYEDAVAVTEEWQKRSALPRVPDRRPERPPARHAPDDPVLAGHPGPPEGLQVRRPLPGGHAQARVLGSHVRRRHGHHRQAPGDRGPHLHALLQGRQVHRPRPEARLGRPTWPT